MGGVCCGTVDACPRTSRDRVAHAWMGSRDRPHHMRVADTPARAWECAHVCDSLANYSTIKIITTNIAATQ